MKTLNYLVLLIALTLSSTIFAQEKQVRSVTGFSKIDVAEGIQVTLTMGDTEKVVVIAPDDYIDKVVTELDGSALKMYLEGDNNNLKGKKIEVLVTAKQIHGIEANSGSSVKTTNCIKSTSFEISVSSGAHANVEIEAQKTEADASSGASIIIRGNTTHFEADASSGANLTADDLVSQNTKADVSSGAHIKLHVEKELEAEASSGGSISYSGKPEMVNVEKSSGGSVHRN